MFPHNDAHGACAGGLCKRNSEWESTISRVYITTLIEQQNL